MKEKFLLSLAFLAFSTKINAQSDFEIIKQGLVSEVFFLKLDSNENLCLLSTY